MLPATLGATIRATPFTYARSGKFVTEEFVLIPGGSLMTSSPEEGRELAVRLSRLTIKLTQPDSAARQKLRSEYSVDSVSLLLAAQVVATEFATIAAANNYWK